MFLAISLLTIQSCGTLFFWSYLSSLLSYFQQCSAVSCTLMYRFDFSLRVLIKIYFHVFGSLVYLGITVDVYIYIIYIYIYYDDQLVWGSLRFAQIKLTLLILDGVMGVV